MDSSYLLSPRDQEARIRKSIEETERIVDQERVDRVKHAPLTIEEEIIYRSSTRR